MSRLSDRVFSRLDYFLVFGFGSGLAPVAPGTAGSLVGLLLFMPLLQLSIPMQVSIIASGFLLGCWMTGRVAKDLATKDPGGIVWDEFVGMWITLLWLPGLLWLPVAFLLFRFFDILKPWPARLVDSAVDGGLGIMLDDVVAAFYALAVLQTIAWGLRVIN